MRRVLISILLILYFPVILMSQEERIYTHHSDIVVDTSGVIRVSEKIRVYADGGVFKRGITRALPITRTDVHGKAIKVNYNILDVNKNGYGEPFFTERDAGYLVIYIGDKDRLLESGYYDYEIEYEVAGQIGFYDEYDELAWNVNGESDFIVDSVSCEIIFPKGTEIISHRCLTGAYGSTDGDCSSESSTEGVFTASSSHLHPDEMMTVYVGFEKGVVNEPIIKETLASKIIAFFDNIGLLAVSLLLIPLFFIYYYNTWRKHGIDPHKPVVVPQFMPPNDMSPANMAMIYFEKYDSGYVTTSIINLAVKGFLRIEEVPRKGLSRLSSKHYKIIKLKDDKSTLPKEETIVMRCLFKGRNEVLLDGSYDSSLEIMMRDHKKEISSKNKPLLKEGQNTKYRSISRLMVILYCAVLIFYGRNEPGELYINLIFMIFRAYIIIILARGIYFAIKKKRSKTLLSSVFSFSIVVGVINAFVYFPINRLSYTAIVLLIGLGIAFLAHMIYSYLIIRPSEKLLQTQADIEGFKMYLSLAEEKQIQYFNPPEITPEVFEKLLPYAIALKVDKVWGEKFENRLLGSANSDESYAPLWYSGSVMRPVVLTSSIRQSLTSNIRQGATQPSSSSDGGGSWSSGSFGGGSVGGGGGGGRTGGW